VDKSSFGLEDEGKTVLLDIGDVGILSESFAMSLKVPFTIAVARCF
jgi:hypothetical protein